MTELATAYISIVPETSQIPRQINQAMGVAGRDAEKQGQQVGQKFSSGFSKNVKQLAGVAGVAGGVAALSGALRSTLTTGMDFTNSLNTMKAVSGATAQQIATVSNEARKLGTDSSLAATSSVDAAQAMVELAKGGFSVDQSMKAARGTLQLAAAAQISAADAATIQSQALQSFGKDASYAAKTADILANAANASSAEITDVAQALAQGGAVSNQFGVSMKDTAATIALLANAGIKGSDAGTLMKSTLLALTDTSEKANAAAEQLGLAWGDNGIQFNGMEDLFTRLAGAQKRMGSEAYNAAAATLFGSDAMRLAGVAAQQGGEGFHKMAEAMDQNGSAADVAKAKMAGLPGAWEQLKNSAEDAALSFYDVVEGPLAKGAEAGANAIESLVSSAKGLAPTVESVSPAVSGLTGVLVDNKEIVLGLAAAYVGLKVVRSTSDSLTAGFNNVRTGAAAADGATGLFSRTTQRMGGAGGTVTNATVSLRGFSDAFSQSVRWMQQANPTMSTTAARFAVLRQNGMSASGGMGLLKGAAGGLMGAFGGPVGIGLTAAVSLGGLALGKYAQHQQEAAQAAAEHKAQVDALSQSINFNTGALDAQGKKTVFNSLNDKDVFKNVEKNQQWGITSEQVQAAGEGQAPALDAVNSALDQQVRTSLEASSMWQSYKERAADAGITVGQLTAAMRGNKDAQDQITKASAAYNATHAEGVQSWKGFKKDLDDAGQSAIKTGEALGLSNDAIRDSIDQARREADALGLVGQRLTELAGKFKGQGKGFSIDVDTQQIAGAEDVLKRIGFTLTSLPNGQVKVTANTDEAAAKLQWVTQNVNVLNALKANPQLDLNKAQFDSKDQAARAELMALDRTEVSPEAGIVIDKLLQGKAVSMSELDVLSKTTANPQVNLEIQKIMEKIGIVNTGLDNAAKPRQAFIDVIKRDGASAFYPGNGIVAGPPSGGYSSGGWTGPGGKYDPAGIVHADEFVVKKDSRRKLESSMPGALDYMNRTGRMPGYAEGGRVSADEVNRFPRSNGLEGAPYVWGGTHWGDCSGAMSAIARFAVGLDPWGGRFATANQQAYLSQLGFQSGAGSSGDLRIGWVNGGPGGGHTAGELPDGTHVEMGGARGNGQVGGGAAGPDNFPNKAFLSLGPSWTDPGSDAGGWVQRPDGTWTQVAPGAGNYGANGGSGLGTSGTSGSGSTSLSGRLGDAAKAAVEGQLQSLFGVVGVNDTPGALAAYTEYENQRQQMLQQQPGGTTGGSTDPLAKQQYEDAKLQSKQDYENAKLSRRQDYDAERAKLRADYEAKRLSRADYDSKLADLKKRFDEAELAKKQEYDQKTLESKQKYDDLQRQNRSSPAPVITDPGSTKPAPGQDLGGSGGVKDAVMRALQPRGWNVGAQWAATDWIANKESTWNPKARNGKYSGLFQLGPEAWAAAGINPTDDPFQQGNAYGHYVDGRYKTPVEAKKHHLANNWYDQGGAAVGTGLMAKNVLEPERVLSPRQTAAFEEMVRRDFQAGIGTDQVVTLLTKIHDALMRQPRGQVNYNLRDENGLKRAERTEKRRMSAALAGV